MAMDVETVTVSPKFQVVIPRSIRTALGILPGAQMRVIRYDGRIEFIPVRPITELRGSLAGIDTNFEREDDRL